MPQANGSQGTRQFLIGKRQLALLGAFLVSLGFPLVLSAIGLFLSLWIVVPAPLLFLLPFGVAAPEISPWLVGVNAIALLLLGFKPHSGWFYGLALIGSLIGLLLSLLPLLQWPAANAQMSAEMQRVLGEKALVAESQPGLRSHPFSLLDVVRGIPIAPIRIDRGIEFACPDGVSLKLNVYRPQAIGEYPAIVVIYGGAWQTGTADNDETFSRYMAAQGYVVTSIDYRHAPQYHFPSQIEDVQTALSYLDSHAETWEIDRQRIALMGRSAGAHLAMLAAYHYSPIPVKAVVNYYGPVNLTQGYYDLPFPDPLDIRAVLRTFLNGSPEDKPDLYQQASPIHYVKSDLPPSLLVYAGRDHLVQPKFGRNLYEKLQAAGNQVVWLNIPWAEHAFDAVFNGVSNQLALYYTERFLAWALKQP